MDKKKLALLAVIVAAIAAFFVFDLKQYLTLEFFQASRAKIDAYYAAHPLQTIAIYFAVYIAVTALSLPGAAIMTLAGGAIFGLVVGTVVVSFASSIGATLAFLAARFLLRDWVQGRFGERLKPLNDGVAKEGAFYLFALRLVPIFPFWLINLAMALTPIRARTFYWVSQLGMLAGTIVYVYAGTQLGQFRISAGLIVAFVLLGIFPLIAKRLLAAIKSRRVYAKWKDKRPAQYDYNLVVIGAGSAGLVSAYIAAATKAKVALVEKHRMGGDCLNTGCVPSKALIRSAKLLSHIARSKEFGIREARAEFDFAEVMERVARVVRTVEPHDSVERYTALGVDCIEGSAKITSPWTVEVDTPNGRKTLATKNIVIAAGARPFVPPIPGIEEVGYLTSDTVWKLREQPKRLVVLGGGPIGSELTQAFARLGSQVTQVEMLPRLLIREDPEVSAIVQKRFESEGIRVLVNHKAKRFAVEGGEKILIAEHEGRDVRIPFDALLVAVGRVANTEGYGLEELGIGTTKARTVETDEYLQTIYPNIYACGDVAGPFQFTHTASHQAWYAAVNALFGSFRRFKADYRVIPWSTFTDPEVARVGLSESEAKAQNIPHTVTVYGIDDLDRAIADGEAHGFVKVLTKPGTDRILGATIVGEHAGDLLAEYVLAMKHGLGMNKILGTIHIYPTLAEANKYAAGNWKRATVTQGQWAFLAAFQAWRRGAFGFGAVLGKIGALLRDKRPAYAAEAKHSLR
ncbi:pyridine nucleotide-disulfide oxidoreductase [Betaproteobacteria bacterium PRO7]|nr:pyridine nucleotide-disulfide oxidoreductase [Betaproteobacteria bacterium PRO7]